MESTFEEENLFSNVKEEVFDFEEGDVQLTKGKDEEFSVKQELEDESFSAFNAHEFLSSGCLTKKEVGGDGVRVGQEDGEMGETENHDESMHDEKKCPVDGCTESAGSSKDLMKHMKNHSAPWICAVCKSSWKNATHLRRHFITHTRERPFRCEFCQKTFMHPSNLKVHRVIHTGKPYQCDMCGFKSATSYDLKLHKRTHSGEKPCTCSICDKHFRRSHDLVSHMRTHSGEKPYACDKCGYKSSQSSRLKRHELIHTGEKPFSCTCGYKTTHSWNLNVHKKKYNH